MSTQFLPMLHCNILQSTQQIWSVAPWCEKRYHSTLKRYHFTLKISVLLTVHSPLKPKVLAHAYCFFVGKKEKHQKGHIQVHRKYKQPITHLGTKVSIKSKQNPTLLYSLIIHSHRQETQHHFLQFSFPKLKSSVP